MAVAPYNETQHSKLPVGRFFTRYALRARGHIISNRNSRFTENRLNPATATHSHFPTATKQHFPSSSYIALAPLLANRQHDNFQFRRDLALPNMPSHSNNSPSTARQRDANNSGISREPVYWRVEGSLLNLTAVRPVGFFTWNAQTFLERWGRRGTMGVLAIARPFLYATNRVFATRLLHTVLRGVSRDRLDLLGEEFFQYFLKPRLKAAGVARLKETIASGADVVLVSQGLDHIMRPLANHLGVERILCNRLDFRDGLATGRLLDPVIRPRGAFAKLIGRQPNGQLSREILLRSLGFTKNPQIVDSAIQSAQRPSPQVTIPVVHFAKTNGAAHNGLPFSVRDSLRGQNILLIGATGFIGKVWLANLLTDLPEIGRIYLLVRRNKANTALARFRRVVEESPVFEQLAAEHGERFAAFLRERTGFRPYPRVRRKLGPRKVRGERAARKSWRRRHWLPPRHGPLVGSFHRPGRRDSRCRPSARGGCG